MKLKRFDKNKKYKKIALCITLLVIGFIGGIFLFNSFAYFEETKSFNIIEGKVPTINKGDIKFAVLLNGEKADYFPSRNDEYKYTSSDCTNDASVTWDNNTWSPIINSLSKSNTVCTISFETRPDLSGNMVSVLKNTGDMKVFAHADTEQTGSNTSIDYRYVGSDPNNYVDFNNELWRIIGVFNTDDGNGIYQERAKLIRATGLETTMAWNSNGTNDWDNATLKDILNGDYYNRTGDYSEIGLTDDVRKKISNAKWYLGAYYDTNVTLERFFHYERSMTKGNSASAINWKGQIGLMYPSDYGFSTSANCTNLNINSYLGTCASVSWLHKGNFNSNDTEEVPTSTLTTWTITPNSTIKSGVFDVGSPGNVGYGNYSPNRNVIRPCVYLKANIEIVSGTGEKNNPYRLA